MGRVNRVSYSDSFFAAAMLEAVLSIDPESKKFILQTVGELAKLSFKNMLKPKKYA